MPDLKSLLPSALFTLLVLAQPAVAGATETVVMDNGDRLNGHMVRMSDEVLEFETGYAGTLRLKWGNVAEIRSDGSFTVRLADERMLTVTSLRKKEGMVLLDDKSEPAAGVRQINPADWETGKASKFSGQVDAALKLERGNTHEDRTDLMSRLEWKKLHSRVRGGGEVEYAKSDGEVTADRWAVETSFDNSNSKPLYYGGRTTFKADGMSDLDLRWTLGPYLGLRMANSDRTKLSAETGFEYTSEDYSEESARTFMAESWRVEFSHFLIPGRLELYHRNNGLISLTGDGGVSFETWSGLRLPITGGLNTSAEIKTSYDGHAPEGTQAWDTLYRLKVGYQW
jgi:hypothetical protein